MKNASIAAKSAALPKILRELLDQFVSGPMTGDAVSAAQLAFKEALSERALGAELSHPLGYPGGAIRPEPRFTGFDDKIVAKYACGITVREAQGFLADQYGVDMSPELISNAADGVMTKTDSQQAQLPEPMYAVDFFNALRVKIRKDAMVRNKTV